MEQLARAHEVEALSAVVEIMRDQTAKHEHRLKAADMVLERARGKSKNATPPPPTDKKRKPLQMTTRDLMDIVKAAQASGRLSSPTPGNAPIDVTPTRPRPAAQRTLKNEWADDLDAGRSST